MTDFRPLQDRVLLRRDEAPSQTASGIYIPDTAKEKPMWCTVTAVGPGKVSEDGRSFRECEVAVGDNVLVGKYVGTDINIGDIEYLIVREEDILGVSATQ